MEDIKEIQFEGVDWIQQALNRPPVVASCQYINEPLESID
jgi:hypothetical protein